MNTRLILISLCACVIAGCAPDSDNKPSVAIAGDERITVTEGARQHTLPIPSGGRSVKLLLSSSQDGYRYLLLDVTRGTEACPEVSALWLKVNSSWEVVDSKTTLHDSCKLGLRTDFDHYALTEKHLWMMYSDGRKLYTLTYDSTYPQFGFVVNVEPAR